MPILIGFDFPIGVPGAYAAKAGITSFPEALMEFGRGEWSEFYKPAKTLNDISVNRPFYPNAPGGTLKKHLVDSLGLILPIELLRMCDRATRARGQACELFWTLGAKQVGKAAIAGWRDLLAPAVRDHAISLWPFEGDLPALLTSARPVVVEIYPGEIYSHLGLRAGFVKTRQQDRAHQAQAIFGWCSANDVALEPELATLVESGFGGADTGEDLFDAFVGLLGLIEGVRSPVQPFAAEDEAVRRVEGWIFGMDSPGIDSRPPADLGAPSRPSRSTRTELNVPIEPNPKSRLCPACGKKLFARWPFGWDGHAGFQCSGVIGSSPEERKPNIQRTIPVDVR
jgi:hypothetical protein